MPSSENLILFDEEMEEDEVLVHFDIATYPSDYTLGGIHELWRANDIEVPQFQREFVWTIKKSSVLIESFLLGLPVPPVFFYIDDEHKNLVIDGQQRIQSIVYYLEGFFGKENSQGRRQVFRLKGLDKRSPYSNKTFSELSETEQRRLRGAVLRAINVRQLSPIGDNTSIYHIFERLNTGGVALKPQEIRNCVFTGPFATLLKELNLTLEWREIMGTSEPDRHQRDAELILRLFALAGHWTQYMRPMKEFLNITMKNNRKATTRKASKFVTDFRAATKLVRKELGEKPFHVRGPLNTAVLDAVLGTIVAHRSRLRKDWPKRFDELKRHKDFISSTTASTADEGAVHTRFDLAEQYLLG